MICYLFTEPIYFFFSPDVPGLLYYSHISTAIISILIGFFVFWNGKHLLLNRLLFAISACFSLWVLSNLILWTNIHSDFMLLIWSFLRIFSSLMSVLCIYFIYVFLEKKDISQLLKIILLILVLPVIVLAPTYFNLGGFNITSCDAFMFEKSLFQILRVFFGILSMVWIFVLLVRKYKIADSDFKRQILLIGVGIELFLFLFFVVTFLAAYFTKIGILPDSRLEYYGLFGMIVFVVYLSILIVRFRAFNVKLIATQALIWGLITLIGAQFFFIKITTNLILNSIAFVGVIIIGNYLILSVKREIRQRERLEQLRIKLENANEKLKSLDKLKTEFVSLASHQLRSPLTAIRGYASMLIDGDYGNIDTEAKDAVDRIYQSSKNLTIVVEDLLNVTKIEAGGMKFEMAPFDLSVVVEDEIKDFSLAADKKGLKLSFDKDENNLCMVNGDKEKIRQIVINYIDNSIKYTKEGEVNVSVRNNNNKVVFCVKDTGMGMTKEIKDSLFQKFSRGDGARVNSTGSGLGLYLAKQIIEAHKGRVWVESDGIGKGSAFFVEIDATKG